MLKSKILKDWEVSVMPMVTHLHNPAARHLPLPRLAISPESDHTKLLNSLGLFSSQVMTTRYKAHTKFSSGKPQQRRAQVGYI